MGELFEYYQCQEIDDKAVYDVDQHINQVVTKNIQFAEFVVQGKCEINYSPGFQELFNGKIIGKASNF